MFQTGAIELVGSLGLVSKSVLVLLFLFSVVSWAIIFFKWRVFRAADRGDQRFMALLARTKDIGDLYRQVRKMEESPCGIVFEETVERMGIGGVDAKDGTGSAPIDRHLIERTAAHLTHSELSRLEAYLPFLATTGNTTPFVGLLGTVLGIIDAFREIGAQGTASIAAVAPGVSEALIATAAGLFTAIPAVIAYNYFLTRIRRTAARMDTVTIELLSWLPASPSKAKPAPVVMQA
jgi:biopolymer transport protein TolQ